MYAIRSYYGFRSAAYWDVRGTFRHQREEPFEAVLTAVDGRRIATGKDFDPETGQLKQQQQQSYNFV